jgi:hypothetical protein
VRLGRLRLHSTSDRSYFKAECTFQTWSVPPNIHFTSLHFSIFTLKPVDMAASIEIIDGLKANLSHGAITITPDSDNYHQSYSFSTLQTVDMAASKEMIDKLKAALSHGAIVVTPDSDTYDESFKRWSAAAEKNPVSLNLPHSSLSSESYLVS